MTRRAFTSKRHPLMPAIERASRRNLADRIAGIRARLADGWRHMEWEARLEEREGELRKGIA